MSGARFVVAQIGARLGYAVPRILDGAGRLERLVTDACAVGPAASLLRCLPGPLRPGAVRRFLGREPGLPRARVRHFPRLALRLRPGRPAGTDPRAMLEYGRRRAEAFGRRVAAAGLGDADGVFVFKNGGLEVLREARRLGLRTVLDQTGVRTESYWATSAGELERWPGWQARGPEGTAALEAACEREREERDLADVILCPSRHVVESLRDEPAADRCRVVPYGADLPAAPAERTRSGGHLRVLLVGAVSLEKGIPYAVEAADRLGGAATFRAVGAVHLLPAGLGRVRERIDVRGQAPRSEIRRHLRWADVLLLPTLDEGLALAQVEAMAAGVPVIATDRAGEVVRDGVDGFVVPVRDPEAIAGRLEALGRDADRWRAMSRAALERSREFGLPRYAARLLRELDQSRSSTSK